MDSKKQEYYWSLAIEPGWIQAAIWTIEERRAKVMIISSSVAWGDDTELIEACNSALSSASQNYPEELIEPSKTVFGVAPFWVSDGQIKKEYLEKIKEVCSKLSLEPSGFVVLPEAISHAIKLDEGTPFSGIVIGYGKEMLDVTLFKLGNIAGTVNIGRSVSFADDVIEGLARFYTGENFPSRIIIYNGKEAELEEARQHIIDVDWFEKSEGKVKFLHTPKIEIFSPEKKLTAVCLAGASEFGEIEGLVKAENEEKENLQVDEDVEDSKEMNFSQINSVDPRDVGFVFGGDVSKIEKITAESEEAGVEQEYMSEKKNGFLKRVAGFNHLLRFKKPVLRFRSFPRKVLPFEGLGRILFIVLVLSLIGFFTAWWFLPKASVVIFVSPKLLSESVGVTFEKGLAQANYDKFLLPAETVIVEVSGKKTKNASGTKTVGDKAKGVVKVRNGTSSTIKLSEGTVLIGPGELKFSLDESTSVSAAESPSSPGTEDVNVTAEDIGAEYNLAKDESFSVGNYPKSEVDAVAKEDFSGGSSKDIVAVSQDDIDKLKEDLIDELKKQGMDKISGQIGKDKIFIEEDGAFEYEIVSEEYSHKVGEESGSVELLMTLKLEGLVISKSAMNELSKRRLESQVPEGYTLKEEQLNISYSFQGSGSSYWDFDVTIKANLLPRVEPDEIKKNIAGKSFDRVNEYLETIPGFTRSEISVKYKFPWIFGVIPRMHKNINIETIADRNV